MESKGVTAGSGLFIIQVALRGLMNSQYLVDSLRDLERLSEEDPSLSPQTKSVTASTSPLLPWVPQWGSLWEPHSQ